MYYCSACQLMKLMLFIIIIIVVVVVVRMLLSDVTIDELKELQAQITELKYKKDKNNICTV